MTTEAKAPAPDFALPDDIRIPLHSLQTDISYLFDCVVVDENCIFTIKRSIRDRLNDIERYVNNAAAKDAEIARLREALETALSWHAERAEGLSKVDQMPSIAWSRIEHLEQIDDIRAALSSIPTASAKGRAHQFYKTGDADAPAQIKDRNGAVVLQCCRCCGLAEAELDEAPECAIPTPSDTDEVR